jgi:hypothetical protein
MAGWGVPNRLTSLYQQGFEYFTYRADAMRLTYQPWVEIQ